MRSELKIFPFQCKLEHLRMLQGIKMIASLENTEVAAQIWMLFSLTQITHTRVGRVVSKVMNFLIEEIFAKYFLQLWVCRSFFQYGLLVTHCL